MKKSCLLGAVCAFALSYSNIASAALIWDQGNIEPLVTGANFSEGTNRIADNFNITSNTTIKSAQFWGSLWPTGNLPAIENWTAIIYSDSASLPGGIVGSTSLSIVSQIDTGFDHNNNGTANILEYTVNFDSDIALSSGNYWFSVYLTDTASGTNFAWQRVQPLGPNARSNDSGANWSNGAGDVAFRLYDNAAVVPIPAAVWLFGSGLLGLAGMARRKKA